MINITLIKSFKLFYWIVAGDTACGESKPQMMFGVTTSGEITSPNYPSNYPNNADCQWQISADFGYIVKITLLEVDLEDG